LLERHDARPFRISREDLEQLDYVELVEKNYTVNINDFINPNDTHYDKQWGISPMRLPRAWYNNTGSEAVRVAVLDTGIDNTHNDLQANVNLNDGYNYVEGNTNTMDFNGHGTHVAGIIGAVTNNSLGIAGVMWDVDIIPIKVLGDDGSGSSWGVADGILHAAGLKIARPIDPVNVINMSLGSSSYSSVIHDAVKQANQEGVIIVAASGNSGMSTVGYPARNEEVIAVGALGENLQLAAYSNYGPNQEITAPGSLVLSTIPGGVYQYKSGTSMASPYVAGVAGLAISSGVPQSLVRHVLNNTAIDLGDENYYGNGLVNAYWVVNNVSEIKITFNGVTEVIDLTQQSFTIVQNEVQEGEYELTVWIDVKGNGVLESGDYYYSEIINVTSDGVYNINVVLEERP